MDSSSTTLHVSALDNTLTRDIAQTPKPDPARENALFLLLTTEQRVQAASFGNQSTLIVGRGSAATVRVDDSSLSRTHARFHRVGDRIEVTDLGSRNGIVFAGKFVKEAVLHASDVVLLGNVAVSVQRATSPSGFVSPGEPSSSAESASTRIIRRSKPMLELAEIVKRAARCDIPVLLLGETGTGKEVLAQEIHDSSPRRKSPLTVVNCAAIPSSLVESVLFGHVRGAFTGAERAHQGVFEQAHGGTVFLDEIGELSPSAQAALLRTLDSGKISAIGSTKEIDVDVRIVAATHRNLTAMVDKGTFRLDLLHRLNSIAIEIPPLRERREEIEPLARHFLNEFAAASGRARVDLSEDALRCLLAYEFPGNVRELRNLMQRALTLTDGASVTLAELPHDVQSMKRDERSTRPRPAPLRSPQGGLDLRAEVLEHEASLIRWALGVSGGNQKKTARLLRLPLRTLERKLHKLGGSRVKKD